MPLRKGLGPYIRHHLIKEEAPSSPGWFLLRCDWLHSARSFGSNTLVFVLSVMVESQLPQKLDMILRQLVALRAPKVPGLVSAVVFRNISLSKVFVITILLIGHLQICDMTMDKYQVLEYYAGAARLAKLSRNLGLPSAAMDIIYDREGDNKRVNNAHDLNTSAGFVSLGSCFRCFRDVLQARVHPGASS